MSNSQSLPGEDREAGGALCVDLIPSSSWFRNVRAAVVAEDWDVLRRHVYARAGYRCELCGADSRLEAHERFFYDELIGIQKLMRIIALCRQCHDTTHFGLASIQGRAEAAAEHLALVRGWSAEEVGIHVDDAFVDWQRRSRIEWRVDLSMITNAGFKTTQ